MAASRSLTAMATWSISVSNMTRDCRVGSVGVTSGEDSARDRLIARLLICALAVPVVVLAARALSSHWISYSDYSAVELRTRAVGTGTTPLIGPFSRYGWSHPGPLLFYALALPYRLLGEHGKGLLLGALSLNVLATALALFVGYRRGRLVGLLVVA